MKETIERWILVKEELNELQSLERSLRVALTEEILLGKFEGSKTSTIDNIKLTATAVVTRTIDASELEIIKDDLNDEELACIQYKPSLVLKNYRKLEDSKLAKAITAKSGLPQLKLV